MQRLTMVGVLMGLLVSVPLRAQPPEFEVASVKRSRLDAGVTGGCHGIDSKYASNEAVLAPPLGRCVIRDGRLGLLILIAFKLRSMALIKGGPDWALGGERFDTEAEVEDPTKTTEDQLYAMLQALLIERFSLKFHRESKDVSGFALVVAKNGPKLRAAKGEDAVASFPAGKPGPDQPIHLSARGYSMPMLADLFTMTSQGLVPGRGPVVDRTGLTGAYDFELSWDETAGPSLFSALQEQLGLRLEPRKVPVSFFVVDSAQRPTEN